MSTDQQQQNHVEYKLFLRRYEKRIRKTDLLETYAYQIYKEQGEEAFLTRLEDEEGFAEFCSEYYDLLRERYNACSALMEDEYERFKTQFNKYHSKYSEDLEKAWRKYSSR